MAKRMVWLSGLLPYEQAEAVFEQIGQQAVPRMSIWRQSQKHGKRLATYQQQCQTQVSLTRVEVAMQADEAVSAKGVSLDGGMVHIRGEGWKEFKIGTVFALATDEIMDDPLARLCTKGRKMWQNKHQKPDN